MPDAPDAERHRLSLLSVVIPARDEAETVASTVEHLHLELTLQHIPHEIVVVDDGSADHTWAVLEGLRGRIAELRPVRNDARHGFGRAVICGFDHARGDALVIMMADESDDCRDVTRYWKVLNEGEEKRRWFLGEPYGPGFYAFDKLIQEWRDKGDMEGLVLSR